MCFDLLLGVAVGDGLGEAFFRFGEVSGDGVGVGFFFRCLRVGVGDGSKAFLIFVPNDSWAEGAASTAPNKITKIKSHFILAVVSAVLSGESVLVVRLDALSRLSNYYGVPRNRARYSRSRRCEFLKNCFVQANTTFEIFERKIFVRRMRSAIG